MKGFFSLASGSKGNCLYFGTDNAKILIDAGVSTKVIESRLNTLNISLDQIDAVLVTHEHSDHISGLKTLTSKYNIPIFANHDTAKGIVSAFKSVPKFKIFSTGDDFEFADMEISPFSIPHDTLDPVAFTIKTSKHKVGICTDLGFVTSTVLSKLKKCDYLFLESNHEEEMVHASARPDKLKKRILGRSGHLSNSNCAKLILDIHHADLKHVHLAHLSGECNTPDVALNKNIEFLQRHGISQLAITICPQHAISQIINF